MSQTGLAVLTARAAVRPRESWGVRGLCHPQLPLAASFSQEGAVLARPFGEEAHQFCGYVRWKRLLERGVRPPPPPALLLRAACCLRSLPTCCQAGERDAGRRKKRRFNNRVQRRSALRMELMAHKRIYRTDWGRTLQ